MLTVGSLFSGIGGIDLGLERAGMRVLWQVEVDDWCQRVLAKHWPGVTRYGDIHDVGAHNLEPVDIIAGGFPCQPVSLAGRGLAQDDDRWLWPQFTRVIRELRPRYVLLENVPGLLARGFGDVLGDLAACGYDAEWECIPASAVGAPHQRDRVWVVAHSKEQSVGAGLRAHESAGVGGRRLGDGGSAQCVSDSDGQSLGRTSKPRGQCDFWAVEPELGRIANGLSAGLDRPGDWDGDWERGVPRVALGVPDRANRLKGLGNAVVPLLVQWIGERIVEWDTARSRELDPC